MTINARPNLNGNSKEDFQNAADALWIATQAVRMALGTIQRDVTHGRNYQTVEMVSADKADQVRMRAAWMAEETLRKLSEEIALASMGD